MNKTKKIAIAAASLVMAGTMALGIVGCGGGGGGSKTSDGKPKVDENNHLTYSDNLELKLNIGNQNKDAQQGISYTTKDLSANTVLPDGVTYGAGSLKPAWAGMASQLKLKLTDAFQNLGSDAQIKTPVDNKETAKYDLISGSLSSITVYADYFVDMAPLLDYMPNYKAFLDANPVTKYSLTGSTTGGLYAAPYFDGNDDIEKYVLADYNLIAKVLGDSYTGTKTYAEQLAAKKTAYPADSEAGKALGTENTKAYATSYMGTTSSYTVKTKALTGDSVVDAKVDYDAAKTAATTAGEGLYNAIYAAAGNKAYDGNSGNIVDLQNFAINQSNGAVTGTQLANILKEYIKVAYTVGGTKYTNVTDVFLSASAAWDVDLFVALSRAAICDGNGNQYGVAARQTTTQRRTDLAAFAGELYGIRGMESRYEYAYFDKDGQLQDARANGKTYDLLNNMSNLSKEGIVYVGGLDKDNKATTIKKGKASETGDRTMMLHDYAQTQTTDGLGKEGKATPATTEYNFAPILTPVSKWDDGSGETKMRFTESWRSVKNTGFAIPKAAVEGNPEKLSAVLALIDYMFSNDGQLLLTFGTQSTNGNTNPNGWWYATESTKTLASVADKVADAYGNIPAQYKVKDAEKANVFVYNGKVYEGMKYSDRNIPKVTDINNKFYLGEEVTVGTTKIKQGTGNILIKKIGDYTNYARYFIGSTLPVGNKDQGYEYQSTAQCAITGAAMVSTALQNGTVKHVKLTLADGENPWYLIVPTALPLIKGDRDTLTGGAQTKFGEYFYNSSSTGQIFNVALDMCYYGLGSAVAPCGKSGSALGATYADIKTGADLAAKINAEGLTDRLAIMRRGWKNLNTIYNLGYVD